MKRPLLIVAISYILGIIMGVYFKTGIPIILLAGVGSILLSYLLVIVTNKKYLNKKKEKLNNIKTSNKTAKFNKKILENRHFNTDKQKINNYIKAIILIFITIIVAYTKTIKLNKKYDSFYEKYNRRRNNNCRDNMQ